MKRFVDTELNKWKDSKNRKPLIIRGARQVGKTYSVEEFGKRSFINFLTLNFEFNHDLKNCFVTLDPAKIVKHIELLLNATIVPGETLLFFDEIQECPQALKSLRFFIYETFVFRGIPVNAKRRKTSGVHKRGLSERRGSRGHT